jgi:hypothetical protein
MIEERQKRLSVIYDSSQKEGKCQLWWGLCMVDDASSSL